MSDVQQRVEPQRNEDALLESHQLGTPTAVSTTVALDCQTGHEADSEIERVIEAERSKVAFKPVPRHEIHRPIEVQPQEEKIGVNSESPSIHAQVIIERPIEHRNQATYERIIEPAIEAKVEFRAEKQDEQTREATVDPKIGYRHEEVEEREELIEERYSTSQLREPEIVIDRDSPKPAKDNAPILETIPTIDIDEDRGSKLETPVVQHAPETEVYTPAKSLEERIEQIRLELNVPQTVRLEPEIIPAADIEGEVDQPLINETPRQSAPVIEARPIIKPQSNPQQVLKVAEPELKMAVRETLNLEQAMKFDLTRAKIGTGQKAPRLRFRGHGIGSGTPLDRLITAIADLIKRWEMRLLSFLTRRRLEKRPKPTKVVSAEEDTLQFESFSSSLAQERKRRRRFFFRL